MNMGSQTFYSFGLKLFDTPRYTQSEFCGVSTESTRHQDERREYEQPESALGFRVTKPEPATFTVITRGFQGI